MNPEKAARRLAKEYYNLDSFLRGEYVATHTLENMQVLFSRVAQDPTESRKTRENYQLAARWISTRIGGRN